MRWLWSRLQGVAAHLAALDLPPLVGLALVGALSVVLSFLRIGRFSLDHDEAIGFYLATGPWDTFVQVVTHRESFGALHYLLLRGWTVLGDSEAVLRSLSALLAVGAVLLTYQVGRALFDRRVGLTAAVLLALNAYLVQFAQEARAYTLATFAVALASWLLVRAIERPSRAAWLAYALAAVLALYAHFLTAFVLAAHLGALLVAGRERVRWRWAAPAAALVLAAATPLLLNMLRFGPERGFIPDTTRRVVRDVLEQLVGGGTTPGSGGLSLLALYGALLVLAAVAAGRHLLVDDPKPATTPAWGEGWRYALAFGWALLPLALSIGLSRLQPTFVGRYLLVALPGLALVGGIALASLRPRWYAALGLAACLLLAGRGLAYWYTEPQKDDWRGVAQAVMARAQPGDAVAFYQFWNWRQFEYHAIRDTTGGPLPKRFQLPLDPVAAWYRASDLANRYARVWLLVTALDETRFPDGLAALERGMQARYRLVEWQRVFGVEVRLYQRLPQAEWQARPPPA
jgi:mannosyltransferase